MPNFLNNINLEQANDLQFKTTAGANAGKIEQNGNDLVLSNAIGDVLLGDGSSDIYIGDGINNVDILFEQSGNIKADDSASNVTLTLGSNNTTLALVSANDIAVTANLDVNGDLTSTGDIIIDNSAGDPFLKLKTAAQEYVLRIDQSDSEKFQIRDITNSATRVTLDTSGNIGIGTESPAEKLVVSEVRSGTNAAAQTKYTLVSRSTIASGQTPGTGGIKVVYDDGSNEHAFGLVSGSSSADFLTSGPMHFYTNSDLNTNNATGYAMQLSNSGQLIIAGTNSITGSAKLSVAGETAISGNLGVGVTGSTGEKIDVSGTNAVIRLRNSSSTAGTASGIVFGQAMSSEVASLTVDTSTDLKYIKGSRSSGTTQFIIKSSGNVGIGTTSPTEKLVVNGSINSEYQSANFSTGNKRFFADGYASGNLARMGAISGSSTDVMELAIYTSASGSTGGTEKIRVDSSGKVGIGDTDPGAKLVVAQPQITSGGFSTPFIELKSTAQTNNTGLVAMSFSTSTADNYGYSIGALRGSSGDASSFVISHHDNSLTGTERMRINSSGNVGIGEPSPAERLHISGSVDNDDVAIRIDNDSDDNSSSTPPSAAVLFNTASNNGYIRVFGAPADTAGNHKMDIGATASSSYLTFSPSGSERMRINSSGNVGINVTDFTAQYGVVPNLRVGSSSGVNNPGVIDILRKDGAVVAGDIAGVLQFSVDDDNNYTVAQIETESAATSGTGNSGGGILKFKTTPATTGGSPAERLRIDETGKVGIGTTDPQAKLEVGDCESSGNIGDGNIAVKTNANDTAIVIQEASGAEQWGLGVNSDGDFVLTDSGTERVRIDDNTGNFGIGTNAPAEKLVISGSEDVSVRINSTRNGTWTTGQVLGAYEFYSNDASGAGAQIKGKIDCASLNQYGAGFHMRFFTAPGGSGTVAEERMRIQSSGAVTIGKTAPGSYNTQGIELSPSGLGGFTRSGNVPLLVNRTSSDGTVVSIRNDNSQVGSISFSGSTTSFNTSSDYRLKENIIDLPNALDKIEQLKPKRFNFISEETTIDGFIAHEVQDVIPQAVFGEKDAVDEEGNPEYQGIDNSKIVPLLVGAIKELKAEIETLKSQINS